VRALRRVVSNSMIVRCELCPKMWLQIDRAVLMRVVVAKVVVIVVVNVKVVMLMMTGTTLRIIFWRRVAKLINKAFCSAQNLMMQP
jgi:hypothetical protein